MVIESEEVLDIVTILVLVTEMQIIVVSDLNQLLFIKNKHHFWLSSVFKIAISIRTIW
jgi:uncharacterized membrane protein